MATLCAIYVRRGMQSLTNSLFFFFFKDTATTEIYPLPLHDALPICRPGPRLWTIPPPGRPKVQALSKPPFQADRKVIPGAPRWATSAGAPGPAEPARAWSPRSEEHTSELQSQSNLVCRLLLEKKTASAAPAAVAETDANLRVAPGEDSGADSGSLQGRSAENGALLDSADAHQKSASAQAGDPVIDSTQTVRRLTPLELADGEGSCWFAVQLMLREAPIDAEQVPNLGIFSEYRLYSVTGLEQDRVMHALRVGFFSSELAAEAVAGYLVAYFDSPVIKRVSIAERERFADTGLAARQDVGASWVEAVSALGNPVPVAGGCAVERAVGDRRLDAAPSDSSKRTAHEGTSLWSRLLATRNR